MELHQIRYFLAVAEKLNFSRAAEQCGVSQPSLTRAIKRLEDELGGPLVRRERTKTHLTELGQKIKPRLQQALSLTEIARKEADSFKRMSTASLSVGVMCTIGPSQMIPLANHITNQIPQLKVTLQTSSGKEIVDLLLSGEIDVAIVGLPNYPDEVTVQELYRERYKIAFPATHRFAEMETVSFEDIEGEKYLNRLNCEYKINFLASLRDCNPAKLQLLEGYLKSLDVRHESEQEDWIQAMIVAGMGCAIIPEFMSLSTELQMRPLVDPEIWRIVGLATVRGRPHTPAVHVFSELCRNMNWGSRSNQPADVIKE